MQNNSCRSIRRLLRVAASSNTAVGVGGLVGYNMNSISNSYATGNVTGNASKIGGLVGINVGGSSSVSTSYATGSVTSTGTSVGGLMGYNYGTVSGSVWLSGGILPGIGGGTTSGAQGLSSAGMQTASILVASGFNFTVTPGATGNNWVIVNANGTLQTNASNTAGATYPMLSSEYSTTINGAHQLQLMEMAPGAIYTLGRNISALTTGNSTDVWGSSGFIPVGTPATGFTGSFDGLGHTISNLTINLPATDYVGLFGYLGKTAVVPVSNLGLINPQITGQNKVGGIAGFNYWGSISNSYVSGGTINGTTDVGGMVGYNGAIYNGGLNVGSINNSYTSGVTVTGTTNVGGLAGTDGSTGNIGNAYSASPVSGTTNVGGLVGNNTGAITNSFWNNTVKATGIGSGTTNGSVGMSAANMQLQADFTSAIGANSPLNPAWDFANTWVMYDTHTSPLLRVFMTPLTVTASSDSKTYNGFAYSGGTATYSCCNPSNVLGTLSFSSSPSEGAINAGSYAMAPGGLWSNQQGYIINYVNGTLIVSPAPLSVTANFVSKIYDSTLTATGTGTVGAIAGAGAGETILSAGSQAFLDKNAGTANKTVRASGVTIQNASHVDVSSNYNITYTDNLISTITPKPLTESGLSVAASKVYDATLNATVIGTAALLTAEAPGAGSTSDNKPYTGDTVSLSGTPSATYNFKDVTTATSVAFGNMSLTGPQAGNYTLTTQPNQAATITAKPLTESGLSVAASKVYDATLNATVIGTAALQTAEAPGAGSTSDNKPYTGDTASLSGTPSATYNFKDVTTATSVAFGNMSLTGPQASNYTLTTQPNQAATITAKPITATGITANDKIYNANDIAILNTGTATITGGATTASDNKFYTSDAITLNASSATGVFATGVFGLGKDVGNGKAVTVSGLTLGNNAAGNYTLTDASHATANITPKPITDSGITANNKIYNANDVAALNTGSAAIVGGATADGDNKFYTSDAITLDVSSATGGFILGKDVGTGKAVAVSGLALGNNAAGNYTLTDASHASANITPKGITESGLSVAPSKVYDATLNATVIGTAALLTAEAPGAGSTADAKPYTGDIVNLTGTPSATYNSKDVVTATSVAFGSMALTGAQAGNYTLTTQPNQAATISAKPLTESGLSVAASKVYDATLNAPVIGTATLLTAEAPGAGSTADAKPYTGDTVGVTTATATYNSKDVATATTVTFGSMSLAGAQAGNYTLTTQGPAAATITPKPLTESGLSVAASKVYDATQAATLIGSAGLLTAEAPGAGSTSDAKPYTGDSVSVTGTPSATYNSKDVATATTVAFGGLSLTGAQLGNYTLTGANQAATITPKPLTESGLSVAPSKVYDATLNATVIGTAALSSAEAPGAGSTADAKPYTGDTVILTGTPTAAYNFKDVATATSVAFGNMSLSGAQAGNYTLAGANQAATITPKGLTESGLSVAPSKVYDATLNATVIGTAALLSAEAPGAGSTADAKPYSGDSVSVTTANATYNSKDVATATTVTFGSMALSGAQAGNYTLTTQGPAAATITPKPLTESGLSVAASKVYDATQAATLIGSAGLLTAEAPGAGSTSDAKPYTGDSVSVTGTPSATYNSKDVATATTVAFGGLSLTGAQVGNYTLTGANQAATITPKPLTESGLSVAPSKVYDATLNATVIGTAALQTAEAPSTGSTSDAKPYTGDTVILTGTPTAAYNFKDVATATNVAFGNMSLSGAQAGNYTLAGANQAATITPKGLTESGLSVAPSKVYDATLNATVIGTAALLAAEAPGAGSTADAKPYTGDSVSVTTANATYNSKDVATATTVTFGSMALAGAQAGDYTLTTQGPAAATITPKPLTGSITTGSSIYGATLVPGTASLTGVIPGEQVTLGTVAVNTAGNTSTSGHLKAGSYSGIESVGSALGGSGAGNYSFAGAVGNYTVSPLSLAVTGISANNKVYDSSTTATLVGSPVVAPISGDVVSVGGNGQGVFVDPNVGTAKTVIASAYSISGADAGNYSVVQPTGIKADVTPALQDPVGNVTTELASTVFTPSAETRPDALHLLPTITVFQSSNANSVAANDTTSSAGRSGTVVNTLITIGNGMGPSLQIVTGGMRLPTGMVNVNE